MIRINKIKITGLILNLGLLIILINQSCQNERITFESLLLEMVDRDRIAQFPSQVFTTRQFSSYDRGSDSPDSTGWFANADRSMFIRQEQNNGRTEYVMMDAEGPGAVVRFWMTFAGNSPGKGIMRFYFDNNTDPVIEGPAFDILSGGLIVDEPLASSVSDMSAYEMRGHNLYLPLPYREHCKITYESGNITNLGNNRYGGEIVYYNLNYRTYEPGTNIVTVDNKMIEKAFGTVSKIQQKLRNRSEGIDKTNLKNEVISGKLKPEEILSHEFSGSKAIRTISLKLDAKNLHNAMRTTIIDAEFDGENTVWCPVGDFFGTGYQIRSSDTWFTKVTEDGLMSTFWVMPFKKNCIIKIHNKGSEEVTISGEISSGKWKWDKNSMHFGTSWHQYSRIFTRKGMSEEAQGSPFDINYVDLSGEGVYAGDALVLFNTAYIWWGEGDEKIYIDGEKFPSHFGTGTEDYYGYAWGGRSYAFSDHPFIAQPDASGNAKPGYVVNIRQRCLDIIPFSQHFRFDMEMWHQQATYMNYAPTCYYYLKPGGESNIEKDFKGVRAPVALCSTDVISNYLEDGKVEAEKMVFSNSCGNKRGSMSINRFVNVKLSNNLHVIWYDGTPDDSITFKFTSGEEGLYNITAICNTGPGFGNFKCCLNDVEIIPDLELLSRKRGVKQVELGRRFVKKGENILTFKVLNSKRESYYFALDFLMAK